MVNTAILFSANPKATTSASTGNVLAHFYFLKNKGAVFWDLIRQTRFSKSDVHVGYIYVPPKRKVLYKVHIKAIKTCQEITRKEMKFIPRWREPHLEICLKNKDDDIWLLIDQVERLDRPHNVTEFFLASAKRKLARNFVVNYDIVLDPNYKGIKIAETDFADTQIWNRLLDGQYSERDIEEILEQKLLMKNYRFIKRQPAKKGGRIDLCYKRNNEFLIIELKKDIADVDSLKQIRDYMRKWAASASVVKGIILCYDNTPKLDNAVKRARNVKIAKFRFNIDFGFDF